MKKLFKIVLSLSIFIFLSCNNSIETIINDYNDNINQNSPTSNNNINFPDIGDPDFKEDNMLAKEYFVYNDATLILAGPKRAVSYEWIFYDIKDKSKKVNVIPYGNSSLTSQKLVLYIPTSQLEEKTYKVTLTVKDKEGNDYTDSCGLVIYNNFTY